MREWRLRLTPLCPAGHLPLKGGDRQEACSSLFPKRSMWLGGCHGSFSPLEGEMPGRTEGGEPSTLTYLATPKPITP
ncbi:lytic murein transglycosylase [Agrobacterium sp. LC34]|nr:lytic murein transglycosylase [Agrobacterium tumefaciens]TKT68322.1 lytic murein transglycosylase [Agrobacterium sp. LC34]